MPDKQFIDGLRFNEPHAKAPMWIKGSISVNVEKFVAYALAHKDERGWLNIDVKESKGGQLYCELNTYRQSRDNSKPKPYPEEGYGEPDEPLKTDDLPF